MSSFLLWSQRVYPAVLLRKRISTVCPEALKVPTLPLDYHFLASNQLMGILIAFKVLQNGNRTETFEDN
jgi:hypothetical protein